MKNIKRIALTALLLAIIIFISLNADRTAQAEFDRQNYRDRPAVTIALGALGEVRYTLAAMLWVKLDMYSHEVTTLDPSENEPLMALIRTVTWLDPHFIQAYDLGAYILSNELKKPEEAVRFIEEGVKNNPDSFDLNWEYGFILSYNKQYSEALPYLLKARLLRGDERSAYDDYLQIRWVYGRIIYCYEKTGELYRAIPYIEEWMALMPGEPSLPELLEKAKAALPQEKPQ